MPSKRQTLYKSHLNKSVLGIVYKHLDIVKSLWRGQLRGFCDITKGPNGHHRFVCTLLQVLTAGFWKGSFIEHITYTLQHDISYKVGIHFQSEIESENIAQGIFSSHYATHTEKGHSL